MRFGGWFMLVLGAAFLVGAGALGIGAVGQAVESSAYHHARACPAGAAADAECLRTVGGSVAAVTEFAGGGHVSADYELDVRTAATTLDLKFSSDSAMLGYAADGNAAVVTMWRGVPVSVRTDGRSEPTTSVPETAFARDLGNGEESGGAGAFFVLAALAVRRNRRVGTQPISNPVAAAALLAIGLSSFIVMIAGFALGGKPSRLGPDLAATGAAVVGVIGLSVWAGFKARRRRVDAQLAQSAAGDSHNPHTPAIPTATILPAPPLAPPPARAESGSTMLRTRLRPGSWRRPLGALDIAWVMPGLTVAVLFGVFFAAHDGPEARAYRQAPACVRDANLATCVGDFTAVINGVRAPANGRSSADVSYVTSDGAINQWGTFDGNSAVIARTAAAEKNALTPLGIRVWRGSIVGAELGGSWHWAEGNPPGNTIPAIFLAVSFTLLLSVVRLRIHRRARLVANRRRLLVDDLCQVVAAAASVALLAYGFWPGAILALAVLLWLGLSTSQSVRRRRLRLGGLHSS